MRTFEVPTKGQVSEANQTIFDDLKGKLGFVPNLYATYAYSNNALKNYLTLNSASTSLNNKEKEAINLAVSEANGCNYCLSAHTAIAKMNGLNDAEILELRAGSASFDRKLNALATFAKHSVETRGKVSEEVKEAFFQAGFTNENLVDTIVLIGDKTISNYLNNTTEIPVDFPEVQPLELVQQ